MDAFARRGAPFVAGLRHVQESGEPHPDADGTELADLTVAAIQDGHLPAPLPRTPDQFGNRVRTGQYGICAFNCAEPQAVLDRPSDRPPIRVDRVGSPTDARHELRSPSGQLMFSGSGELAPQYGGHDSMPVVAALPTCARKSAAW